MHNNEAIPQLVDILVVEDSETQAAQIAHLLGKAGYRVRIARDGHEGLQQARAAVPTLIVSDIAMPGMDGFEMCRRIKQDARLSEVPVILLTALNSLYDVIRGLDCGADNFIRKPFESKYLLARIRFILANRALRSNEKVQLGMQVNLGGQTHFITAERQQIFDLLMSTYEEAIQMTEELRAQQNQITHSYQSLEGLYRIAEALGPAITADAVAEMALDRALDLPGIAGGCIKLLTENGDFRVVAVREFDADAEDLVACGDCACRGMLRAGELKTAGRVPYCPARASTRRADSGHVSVPLSAGGRTFGVLNLVEFGESGLAEDNYQVLNTVGSQIAVALERAYLYGNMEAQVKERTQALQAERNLLSGVVNTTGALVVLTDPQGRIAMFNRAAEQTLGWAFEEVRGRPYWEVFLKEDRSAVTKRFFDHGDLSAVQPQIQGECVTRDGSTRYVLWSAAVLRNAEQEVEYLLATGIDVTELRSTQEQVHYLHNFDVLTGLPNRMLLRDRVRQIEEKIRRGGGLMGFLLVHFARLPLIRETLGHGAEQALLQQVAERLKAWTAGDDSAARVGDSSFAVVATRQKPDELSALARQLLALMDEPFQVAQQELHLEASIGITVCPTDGVDYETLARDAEVAMRRALANMTERYQFYLPELNRGAAERLRLENNLRRALERSELVLHYQPQVDIRTGAIIGLEALLRWQHPELGNVPPNVFIGIAEETGLILPIGEWVLRQACQQNRAWHDAGLPRVPVAVNLSAKQFSGKIVQTVREILDETGLEPGLLELELTESLSMEDPETTIGILRELKQMGIRLAIDDFGTGYSNLNYLKRFPVDKLKLDQSFVRDLISDPDDLAIARAVIAMAHSLRLKVIAEGVETGGQLALLAQHGCDEMQGYLLSRPVDADACAALLRGKKPLDAGAAAGDNRRTLLLLDHDAGRIAFFGRLAATGEFRLVAAEDSRDALDILAAGEVGVVVCAQDIPAIPCVEILARARQMYPNVRRMAASAAIDPLALADAVNRGGVCRILSAPFDESCVLAALAEAFAEFECANARARG